MAAVTWNPSAEVVERANVTRLMRQHAIEGYRELVYRSQEEPEWFWPAAIEDLGLDLEPWQQLLDVSAGIEWTRWFLGSRLNVATNCAHRHARDRPNAVAAVFRGEDGARRELTFAELSLEVIRLAEALQRLGVRAGDRVGLYLPQAPEAAIASHACAHIGATQVPIFSGFTAPAVAERLRHSAVKAVLTADASLRRGSVLPHKATLDEALDEAPSVESVLVWRRLGGDCPMSPSRDAFWDEAVAVSPGVLPPAALDAEHPYLIAYTSGTTGKPKGAVHATAGFLVKIAAEVAYHADARSDDHILFATDLGWIMGPWTLVGAGAAGTTIVFMEGAPDSPGPGRLWQLVEEERVSILGLSPTLARGLASRGDEHVTRSDRSCLRTFVTTGEPWNPAPYRWLADVCGEGRVPVINISGGTEVGAAFVSCSPVEPIKECSVGFPSFGMAVDVVDSQGRTLPPGEVGELVCRRPWPGMTRGFLDDPERYLDTYWRTIPGMWVHGDFASRDEDGCWYLHGRSDDTLNLAGKRIGPAELESAAVSHPSLQEAAAVGVPHDVKGEAAWLFCVLRAGAVLTDSLAHEVADCVAAELGRAFRPERVLFVDALPRTRSAKIVRRAIRATAIGADPGDLSSVENPESLVQIAQASSGDRAL
jgi:acetyl-CoA synthetase